jgi:hypothetical protein
VLTNAAQQRYSLLREFVNKHSSRGNAGSRNVAATGILAYFTYLRETRRTNGLDGNDFLSDINSQSVEAFLENEIYLLPKTSLLSKEKFKQIMLEFPEFLGNQNEASLVHRGVVE